MATASLPVISTKIIEQQVIYLISQRKATPVAHLRPTARLSHDLHFDLVDVVDIILELERRFHLTVPDEVPFYTVGDFVRYVARTQAVAQG